MLNRTIRYATSRPKRVIALWVVIVIALSNVAALKGHEVMTDDTARFLPKSSESAQAERFARDAFGRQEGVSTVTALVERTDRRPLTAGDRAEIAKLAREIGSWRADTSELDVPSGLPDMKSRAGRIVATAAGPLAPDGRFQLVGIQWKANATDPVAQSAFRQIRDRAAAALRDHALRIAFTGGVASASDQIQATAFETGLQKALLLGSVVLLSLLFFRGPLAAIVPLVAIYGVAGAAFGLIVLASLASGLELSVGTPDTVTVVLVGIGIDYFLFLLFRTRERLRAGDGRRAAAAAAAGRVGPVIASAALAIVVAFAALGLAEFGEFRVLGPAIAISVLVMLLAGVTLMPALVAVTGRALFWPSRKWMTESHDGPAARLGGLIARRPGPTALVVTAVLVALSTAALGTKMSYDMTEGITETTATRAAAKIAASLSEGASDPQQIYVKADRELAVRELAPLRERIAKVEGVGAVGRPLLTPDRRGAVVEVALEADSVSKAAMEIARGPMRDAARDAAPAGTTTLVGGTASMYADVKASVERDMRLIFPVAVLLIGMILVATLRSAVAPLYLLGAVALEFAATLGAAVALFQVIGDQAGVAFTLPLVLFLFVVALGTDYNILMTARLREEMRAGRGVRDAVREAVRQVAPAVGAAGLVLAASFATLMLASGQASKELGFAMAFGILVASLIVSSVLVPALTALAGRRAWWPGRAARERGRRVAPPEEPAPQPAG